MIAMLALALVTQDSYVYDVSDLPKHEIVYLDDRTRYFLAIDGDRYIIGTPVRGSGNPDRDQPQGSGKLGDCASPDYACTRIAEFAFVAPKTAHYEPLNFAGMKLSVRKNGNRVEGKGECGIYTPQGCEPAPADGHPRRTYSYSINEHGVVDRITISYWNIDARKYESHELTLRSKKGITPLPCR